MRREIERLTYVEDDPDIRAIVEIAFTQIGGFNIDTCASGAEAVARTAAFAPDLIILDVMMPSMDGIETLKQLRKIPELRATPIIFMTAKAMTHEIEFYRSLGAVDVISKPFDPLTLPERVREIWQQAQEHKGQDSP